MIPRRAFTFFLQGRHFPKQFKQQSALYHGMPSNITSEGVRVIDLRTDCLSQPTEGMKQAMVNATFGDDVFNEDPTVHKLQNHMADMFGKEAALFVPSGTMGNLICVMCHCDWMHGLEVLMGDKTHICMYEQGGIAVLGGIHTRQIPNLPDGTFELDDLATYIRPRDDPHQPITGLVTVENTHNNCGGKALPMNFMEKLRKKADEFSVPVHLDGARVLHAAVHHGLPVKHVVKDVDSLNMCFSKAVGAPIGSIIAGSKQLIDKAFRLRKMLGGGWRQPGPLAAAALYCMEDATQRIERDHSNARSIAQAINEHGAGIMSVDMEGLHSNIVMINIHKPGLTAPQVCERLDTVKTSDPLAVSVKVRPARLSNVKIRMYAHSAMEADDMDLAIAKWQFVLKVYSSS